MTITTPDGHLDDDTPQTSFTPTPAIPSRAGPPSECSPMPPMFDPLPTPPANFPAPPKHRRGPQGAVAAYARPKKVRTGKLAKAEIKKINTNRKKNMKKATKPGKFHRAAKAPAVSYKQMAGRAKRPPTPAAPAAANRNRPLEMKNRLTNVLALVAGLQKPEVTAFTACMAQLEGMTRSGRKRVIEALSQVYA